MSVVVLSDKSVLQRPEFYKSMSSGKKYWCVMEAYGFKSIRDAKRWAGVYETKYRYSTLIQKMDVRSRYGPWAIFSLRGLSERKKYERKQRASRGSRHPRRRESSGRDASGKSMPASSPRSGGVGAIAEGYVRGCPSNCSMKKVCNHSYCREQNICPLALIRSGIMTKQSLYEDIKKWERNREG